MHTSSTDCPLRLWHRAAGLRGPRGFHGGRDHLLELARARYPDALVGGDDVSTARAALASGRPVLGLRVAVPAGVTRLDLLLPTGLPAGLPAPTGSPAPAGDACLVVLHGGKEADNGRPRAADQLGAALHAGLAIHHVAVGLYADAGPPRRGQLDRWGPADRAAAVLITLPGVQPRAPEPPAPLGPAPDPIPSPKACRDCPAAPRCAAEVPGWSLAQLAGATPAERAAWRSAGLHTPADVLAHAPPRDKRAVRQLTADRDGRPATPPGWTPPLADLPADAVALDLEGFDAPLAPWPERRAFPRTITQIAVARLDSGEVVDVGHWMADLSTNPDHAAAEALLALCPPQGPLLVWGHEDRRRINELAGRVPERAAALRAVAERIVDLQDRLSDLAFPGQVGHGLKSTSRAALADDPWAGLPPGFDPAAARRSLHHGVDAAHDADLLAHLTLYCLADARAVLLLLRAVRALPL
jgi:hypothetical protein